MEEIQQGVEKQFKRLYSVTVEAAKLTGEALSEILKSALEQGGNGLREFSEDSFKSLEKSGRLENIEVSAENIGDLADIAAKYDIDCFIKRDKTAEKPTYRVFFKTSDTEKFQKVFHEYADLKSGRTSAKKERREYHLPDGYRKRVVKNIGKYYSDPAHREQRSRNIDQDRGQSR